MSVSAVAWAFEQQLPPNEKVVLLALADCENGHTMVCIPGQERIAEMSSQSVRTVRRMLEKLEERGLIERTRRDRSTGRTSDSYTLNRGVNLSGGVEPTGQPGLPHRSTVSGMEPEEGTRSNTPPTPSADDDAFEALWTAWPRKVKREDALRAWRKLSTSVKNEAIPHLVAHANAYRQHTPPQFIPGLAPFLNGKRWHEDLAVSRDRGAYKPEPKPAQGMVIPQGHVPVRNELGQIIGSRPA